jgi:hypothetical protein
VNRKFLSLFLSCLAVIAAADSAPSNALTTTQLMAWLPAGISNKRLLRLVHERGLDVAPTISEVPQLAALIRMRLPTVPQTVQTNIASRGGN